MHPANESTEIFGTVNCKTSLTKKNHHVGIFLLFHLSSIIHSIHEIIECLFVELTENSSAIKIEKNFKLLLITHFVQQKWMQIFTFWR